MTDIDTPAWELRDVTKAFPGVVANDQVSICLNSGQIQGLLGENGCGKSTLIKTLCGVHQPDSGEILCKGEPVVLADPISARRAGIATVFQEFSVVPTLSVAENIFLGRLPHRRGLVDWKTMEAEALSALSELNVDIDPRTTVGDLSVAQQQLVEIAKAIAQGASMVILDEPTTALGLDEIKELHRVLRRLRDQGAAILYISHRLDEVVELVDCATVMKDGKVVSDADATVLTIPAIVGTMVGTVEEHYPKQRNTTDDVILEVRDVTADTGVEGISFDVHRGEVFGLGGVLGSGRTEIAQALFGVTPMLRGSVRIHGRPVALRRPQDAIEAGLAFVPENRKFDGLFFNFAGLGNISIASLGALLRRGLLDLREERAQGRKLIDMLQVTPEAEDRLVGLLSGGNQQKIVIARWLFAKADVFILDEPTQGIDVGAKIAVYQLINDLTATGKAVILISADHDELLAMSDRIGIISQGRLIEIRQPHELDKTDLVRSSTESIQEVAA